MSDRSVVQEGPTVREEAESVFWRTLNRVLPKTTLGDRIYTRLWFRRTHGRWPTRDPLSFHDRLFQTKTGPEISNPLRTFTSDKEFVKLFVSAVVGDRYNVATISVLRAIAEVQSYAFPHRCVIKPTHLSGPVILRKRGEPIDMGEITGWFSRDHYFWTRETNYRRLARKVIVEEFVFDAVDVNDYKIFCYRGEPRMIQVDSDRHTHHTRAFFDCQWRSQPFSMTYPQTTREVPKPDNLDEMLEVARALSEHFDFVRIDLYSNGSAICVGEITHVHGNVREYFEPRSAEAIASKLVFGSSDA